MKIDNKEMINGKKIPMLKETDPKKYITKSHVIEAAKSIASEGIMPTLTQLQARLGCGSKVTIHKYFKQWKQECFKNFSSNFSNYNNSNATNNTLVEKQGDPLELVRVLKLEVAQQGKQIQYYAQELINAEKLNLKLTEENQQLTVELEKLQLETTVAKDWRSNIEFIIQQIKAELNLNTNVTIQNMQQTIDDLRLELKTLNETSIAALRDTSFQGHELLMQEKVNSINLQTKIDSLNKELIDSHKQFNVNSMAMQMQIKLLSRENGYLKKILQANIGAEQLAGLELDELNLNITSKERITDLIPEATIYAK